MTSETVVEKRFEVDTEGFKTQMTEKKLWSLIGEIITNSFDEEAVKRIDCNIGYHQGRIRVMILDDGEGFRDITEAFTLYMDSYKRVNPEQSGRFNLGEKEFFAVAETATIRTRDNEIYFVDDKRIMKKISHVKGTEISASFDIEVQANTIEYELRKIAVRDGKDLYINNKLVEPKKVVKRFKANLMTVIAQGKNKQLHSVKRECDVVLYDKDAFNTPPILYELGIPVQTLQQDLNWHVDIRQKVPQPTSRDVVSDKYLQTLFAEIAKHTIDIVPTERVGANWINDALKKTDTETTKEIFVKKYGTDKVVVESKTDYRANERAEKAGCYLVKGSQFDSAVRDNLKSNGSLKYASSEYGADEFECAKAVVPTPEMVWFAKVCVVVAKDVIKKIIFVDYVTTKHTEELAEYGSKNLTWNVRTCGGKKFFKTFSPKAIGILVHELSHDKYGGNEGHAHLSLDYLHEMERIAGFVGEKGIQYWIDKVSKP